MENDSMLSRRSLLATTAALTVGISGCTGGGTDAADEPAGQQTDEPTTEPSGTATNTEDPAPSLDEFEYPEGSDQGGVDARALYRTHESTVTGAGSVTVDVNSQREISGDGQTFEDSTAETRSLGSGGIVVEREESDVTETVWSPSDEDAGYVRMEQGFDTAYRIDNQGPSPNEIALLRQVSGFLRGGEWGEATEIVEDGDGYAAVYESTGVADEQRLRIAIPGESISQFDAEIRVSGDGYLSEISFEATAERGSQTFDEDSTIAFRSVGETTVGAPEWVDTAREQGARFDASVTGDGTAVDLEMVNGDDLPSGARLALSTARGRGAATLPDAFSVGDRLYLALSKDGELLVGRDAVPDGATSLGNFARVTIRADGLQFLAEQFQP